MRSVLIEALTWLAVAAYQHDHILVDDAQFDGDARQAVFDGIEYTHTTARSPSSA